MGWDGMEWNETVERRSDERKECISLHFVLDEEMATFYL